MVVPTVVMTFGTPAKSCGRSSSAATTGWPLAMTRSNGVPLYFAVTASSTWPTWCRNRDWSMYLLKELDLDVARG